MAMKFYEGGCQCGAVRFRCEADLDQTITCNCSRCQKLGSVLSFTLRENFTLLQGEANLSEYLFNKHVIHHQFCSTCGIESFAYGQSPDGGQMAAINANCLDGVDPRALKSHHYDGKSA
jgi:hypothetical protein